MSRDNALMRNLPMHTLSTLSAIAPPGAALVAFAGLASRAAEYDPPDAELASVARARPTRRAQFFAGRLAAQQAGGAVGLTEWPALLPDQYGAPQWPPGLCGSITHSSHVAIAIVGQSINWHGLGIDCEPLAALDQASCDQILLPSEQARFYSDLARMAAFSAKESVYKALHSCDRADARALEFLDVEIAFHGSNFTARPITARARRVPELLALRGVACRLQALASSGHPDHVVTVVEHQ